MSCKKAQGFLESNELEVTDLTDANKVKKGRAEALALARGARTVVVARGKKAVTFDMKGDAPDDDTLAAHLLGPTGNLRAPTARVGRTLVVGFNADVYAQVLGG